MLLLNDPWVQAKALGPDSTASWLAVITETGSSGVAFMLLLVLVMLFTAPEARCLPVPLV